MEQLEISDEADILIRTTASSIDTSRLPRTLMVVAHPDDESIAIGARMSRFRDAHFVHVTDGAPTNGQDASDNGFPSVDAYREARARELRSALCTGGIENPHLHPFNVPDQQASLNLVAITRRIAGLLADLAPEVVLTHPYEGGHPDHDACAFAVHHAVGLHTASSGRRTVVMEAPFYHAMGDGSESGRFIAIPGAPPEHVLTLSPEEIARKESILSCFVSQRETLKQFPLEDERFRLAPAYDFTRAPHSHGFLYDRFPWGTTSQRFLELAAAARAELCHEISPCPEPS